MKDIIVIIPDKKPEKVGDIIIPETNKNTPYTGIVYKSNDESVPKGSAVVFKRYGATTVTIDRDEFLLVPREDILAIIED